MNDLDFGLTFQKLTGSDPFPWQERLYSKHFSVGELPRACVIPTGLGKTSVIAIWLIALANGCPVPRRLIYVVNRRTVVDQTTTELEAYRERISSNPDLSGLKELFGELPISTLRGQFADNGHWCEDPSRPAVVCGTVDMIGSRLLFGGYGIGRNKRPLHAALLGQDALLVHDEAHLEPAFQALIASIELQQRDEPDVSWPKLSILELTATSKSLQPFRLTKEDYGNATVARRMTSNKQLFLVEFTDPKRPEQDLSAKAVAFKDSEKAILVFASNVDTVEKVQEVLRKEKQVDNVCVLTGTMRGKEREHLATENAAFARFLPGTKSDQAMPGTVYLISTSAGEVGVNISADHLISDLSTFDSMAQRFGRVNRFGNLTDTEIHVFHPGDSDWDEKHPPTVARKKTLALLRELNGNASPQALDHLGEELKRDAFAPEPIIPPATRVLFDAWALTTVTSPLPGRAPLDPFLHGITEYELPETQIAWRSEVEQLDEKGVTNVQRRDALLAYPLLPRELLREPSFRAFKKLGTIAQRFPDAAFWIVRSDGEVDQQRLQFLTDKGNLAFIENVTILLPPRCGGLDPSGMLDASSAHADDVSFVDNAVTCRWRNWDTEPQPDGIHEVYRIDIAIEFDDEEELKALRWFNRRNTGESRSSLPVALETHTKDVENRISDITNKLPLDDSIKRCLLLAAEFHDFGKRRPVFQALLGNPGKSNVYWAKSGRRSRTLLNEKYRHEFGSMHDLPEMEQLGLTSDERDLVLHLIAAHHGRARPHFPLEEVFDPHSTSDRDLNLATSVVQRFSRLQRKYGRWGLAYLESILRAADWAASANPSEFLEVESV